MPANGSVMGIGGSPAGLKRVNMVGKNEIVNEYLYDSDEESLKINTD